ncbi:hypothetical protein LCGC14_0174640 [marine sediment metagenome]|uniref:Uncharacterized protein n=1 Tax=marine sediment metagenome TaxID=412755 RepID=A0A0F9UR24_9ZZZZ
MTHEHEDHVLAIIVQLTMVSIFCDTCRTFVIMIKNKSPKVHLRDFTVERLTTE